MIFNSLLRDEKKEHHGQRQERIWKCCLLSEVVRVEGTQSTWG